MEEMLEGPVQYDNEIAAGPLSSSSPTDFVTVHFRHAHTDTLPSNRLLLFSPTLLETCEFSEILSAYLETAVQ